MILKRFPELEKKMKDSGSRWRIWLVVEEKDMKLGHWYDFVSEDGIVGQCKKRLDGTWEQDPRGKNPVILSYTGRGDNETYIERCIKTIELLSKSI